MSQYETLEEQLAARDRFDAHRAENEDLEREAVALINQYGLFLPAPAKDFFRKLAVHLDWPTLKAKLK